MKLGDVRLVLLLRDEGRGRWLDERVDGGLPLRDSLRHAGTQPDPPLQCWRLTSAGQTGELLGGFPPQKHHFFLGNAQIYNSSVLIGFVLH